jgi:hypothetical protein
MDIGPALLSTIPRSGIVRIAVTADPDNPRPCEPADLLQDLMAAGRLGLFFEAAAEPLADGLGNCHETSVSLLVDLTLAGRAKGWHWATGETRHFASGGTRKHSWLEVDGWALDYLGDTLVFADRWWYRRLNKAKNVKLRDSQATTRWLQQRAGGVPQGSAA